jgi:hypothetical protein
VDIKFDFDGNKFNTNLESAVKQAANAALTELGRGLQSACDAVASTHSGKSPEETYMALKAEIGRRHLPVEIDDEDIRAYAEAIADGRRVSVSVRGI